jgi:porphobilinogen synthase
MTRYPITRMRRLRKHPGLRRMVRETTLTPDAFIYPMFVRAGTGPARPVGSMPGVNQWSLDLLGKEVRKVRDEGIPAVILFGLPETKDAIGSASWRENGIVQQALGVVREAAPELVRMVDVCFCEYTEHGHCGVMKGEDLDNDSTLENLKRQAVSLAQAGADVIAPSGMIDGMVGAIREALDGAAFHELPILSYAAKFASGFYGPFRDAAESTDMVMVKPALPYLDVIYRVKERFGVPTAAYQVSGEYSMLKAAGEKGWIDERQLMMETLVSIRRAGADMILTYFALDAARLLRGGWSL